MGICFKPGKACARRPVLVGSFAACTRSADGIENVRGGGGINSDAYGERTCRNLLDLLLHCHALGLQTLHLAINSNPNGIQSGKDALCGLYYHFIQALGECGRKDCAVGG
jgi:hypothetical protein